MTLNATSRDAVSPRLTILEWLRQGTRAQHEALEAALPLGSSALRPAVYDRLLRRFWGFYATWEEASARSTPPALAAVLALRCKLPLLEADLRSRHAMAAGMPKMDPELLPNFGLGAATLLGSMYVVEGATLGGQVISRSLERQGFHDGLGYSFFQSYGRAAGQQWRAFTQLLGQVAEADAEVCVEAARQTFQAFADWFALDGFAASS